MKPDSTRTVIGFLGLIVSQHDFMWDLLYHNMASIRSYLPFSITTFYKTSFHNNMTSIRPPPTTTWFFQVFYYNVASTNAHSTAIWLLSVLLQPQHGFYQVSFYLNMAPTRLPCNIKWLL